MVPFLPKINKILKFVFSKYVFFFYLFTVQSLNIFYCPHLRLNNCNSLRKMHSCWIKKILKKSISKQSKNTKENIPKMNSQAFSGQPKLLSGITSRSSILISDLQPWHFEKVSFVDFLFSLLLRILNFKTFVSSASFGSNCKEKQIRLVGIPLCSSKIKNKKP